MWFGVGPDEFSSPNKFGSEVAVCTIQLPEKISPTRT